MLQLTQIILFAYPKNYLDCSGNCLNDDDNDGVCNEDEVFGCTDSTADNFTDDATEDDGSCIFLGCIDNSACNFVDTANTDDGTCTFPDESYLDCDGNCINDLVGDSVCDENEVFGCTDSSACNYVGDDDITTDTNNDLCTYPDFTYLDCNGVCINDSDGD